MKITFCILIGYLLGSLNPAALISRLKHKSLRNVGTGNLGATNTALVFGKKLGALVMIFDIAKAYLSVWCARWIAPEYEWLAMLTGAFAVLGHCFPFYLKFKGGKGLAAFGGLVLAYDPLLFLILLITGVALVVITNCGTALAYFAAVFFPAFVCVTDRNVPNKVISVILSIFLMVIFIPNLLRALSGKDSKPRDFIKEHLHKK